MLVLVFPKTIFLTFPETNINSIKKNLNEKAYFSSKTFSLFAEKNIFKLCRNNLLNILRCSPIAQLMPRDILLEYYGIEMHWPILPAKILESRQKAILVFLFQVLELAFLTENAYR